MVAAFTQARLLLPCRHLQDSINAAAQVSDEVVGWQAAMLLQTCWFNGEAGKSLNIAHVRSLMHKLRWALKLAHLVAESPVGVSLNGNPVLLLLYKPSSSLCTAHMQLLLYKPKGSSS